MGSNILDVAVALMLVVVVAANPAGALPSDGQGVIETVQEVILCVRIELRHGVTVPAVITVAYHPVFGEAWLEGVDNVRAVEVWPILQEP